ncbi:MAG: hypothetical protein HDT44_01245 [Ruminococcaceae bacterium]|nr:hypothetical protein [Oscillospiraceae bacterium]
MNKIDWKRKLTSRKLWVAFAGLVTGIIIACGGSEEAASTVSGCIMSAASVTAYIIGEGLADCANKIPPKENEEENS